MTTLDATVVIPVHDRAHTLRACIDSVLRQTLPPSRIVVVDDGSTDDSVEIAAAMPVTLVRHWSPRGSGAARNTGVAAADTEWIAFLDSDDEWLPHHLAIAARRLDSHVLVTAPMIDSFGRGLGNVTGVERPITPASLFFPENIVCTSTVVARREAIDSVGGFGGLPRAQDLDLWVRLLRVGTGIALTEPTAVYTAPARYQAPDLRARSVAGAEQVRSRYADETWMTDRLVRGIDTQLAWDELRHAQHRGDPKAMLQSIRRLRPAPATASLLGEVLAHRRRARRFATATAR